MKIRILASVLIVFAGLFAGTGDIFAQKPPAATEVRSKDLEGTVEVSFKIDASGRVEVLSINATSPQLADYVINKLKKIKLDKGDPQIGQVVKYRFVFKKQV